MADTNIGYWEKVLQNPTPGFRELIDAEYSYLLERIPANSVVLDIGCGEGRNIKTILQKTDTVFGLDSDEIAIKNANSNFSNNKTVKILKGSAAEIPFEDKTFDVIVFFDILQNLDIQKEEALKEASRVIKDGGIMLLCTYSESAFDERMRMYDIIAVPIIKKEGTKVFFDKSVGANISEQFSLEDIKNLTEKVGLQIVDSKKAGDIAYLCTLKKRAYK
jgi:ubiquinone/menaquinone biosynthesis C-methylase UbiE